MHIGVVSDTHDNADVVQAAIEQFATTGVATVIHCGDFVAPFSVTPFDGDWDFYAVRGNNDGEWAVESTVEEFGTYLGEMGELTLDGTDIAVYHGTSGPIVDALVESDSYDYVFHGHTHERGTDTVGDTTRLNPGGIAIPPAPEPFSVAVLDTERDEIAFYELE
jgi:putative phosphoesterase